VFLSGEMQLTPDTAAFLAMRFDFPSPSPKTWARGINTRCERFPPGGRFETDIADFARLLTQL
jgi:hypothetical protein